jgi:zinc transport system ATP-binding protein
VRTLSRLVAQGLTLLVVTHEVAPLLDVLTRVVVVEDGRITRDEALAVTRAEADARWT